MRSGVARVAGELGEVAAKACTTCRADLDRVSRLMRFTGVLCTCRRVLHGRLMRGLSLFGSFCNVKIVLILPAGIRVLRRVQDLLLALQLLLQHYLGLLLVRAGATVLQGLGVTSGATLRISFVNSPRATPIVL